MSPENASRMTKITGVISIGVALLLAAGAYPPIDGPAVWLYDFADWPVDGGANAFTEESRLLCAIAGGVFAGLSMMLIVIVAPALRRGDNDVRRAAIITLATWFAVDSAASIAAGVTSNAVINTIYLALVMAPLLLVKKTSGADKT